MCVFEEVIYVCVRMEYRLDLKDVFFAKEEEKWISCLFLVDCWSCTDRICSVVIQVMLYTYLTLIEAHDELMSVSNVNAYGSTSPLIHGCLEHRRRVVRSVLLTTLLECGFSCPMVRSQSQCRVVSMRGRQSDSHDSHSVGDVRLAAGGARVCFVVPNR